MTCPWRVGPQQKLFRSCSKIYPSGSFFLNLIPGTLFLVERSKEYQTAVFQSVYLLMTTGPPYSTAALFFFGAMQIKWMAGKINK